MLFASLPHNPVSEPSAVCMKVQRDTTTIIISHYSLHLVLGNLETQTLQGKMVPTSLSYSIRICILAFNKLPVFPHLQSSNMDFPAAYRLGERHKEIYSLPIKCLCQFLRVVIIKYSKLGGLKEQILFSQCFGVQKSKICRAVFYFGICRAVFTPKTSGGNPSLPLPSAGIPWQW